MVNFAGRMRGSMTDGDLTVTLTGSDASEAFAPPKVTILDGQDSATFIITGVDDGYIDTGTGTAVTFTAAAEDYIDSEASVAVDTGTRPAKVARPFPLSNFVRGRRTQS